MSELRAIEASGPDIESAVSSGIKQLGVSREDVIVEVLEDPEDGYGATEAKVRLVVLRAPAPPPKSSASGHGSGSGANSGGGRPAPRQQPPRPQHAPRSEPEIIFPDDDDEAWDEEPLTDDDLAAEAKVGATKLQELLQYLHIEAKVITRRAKVEQNEAPHFILEVQGTDLGVLIGRRGETLIALQYVTRLMASRDLERRAHIVVDIEGYRARRETMLRRLAKRMADQAMQRGRTVSLEPMPPHERRIIHLTLRNHPSVTTESVGEGDNRKVTIVPRNSRRVR